MFQTVQLKNYPELSRVIRRVSPSYKKHKAFIVATEKVTLTGTYWDGGSRSTYTAVDLATGCIKTGPQFDPPQFGGPFETPEVELPEGVVLVKTGVFCGKTATATIYIHPNNLTKMLPNT